MAINTGATGKRRIVFSGYVASPSTGDGADGFHIPFGLCHHAYFGYALDVGGTSGDNKVQLNRVRNESDTALLAATLDVANDASTVSNSTKVFQNNSLEEGDLVRVDIDEAAGSSGGFTWTAVIHVEKD